MAHSKLQESAERSARAPAGVSWILQIYFKHIYPYFKATCSLVYLTSLHLTGFQGRRVSRFTSAVSPPVQRERRSEAEAVWTPVSCPEGPRPESCRSGALRVALLRAARAPGTRSPAAGTEGPRCQGPAGLWLRPVAQET